MVQRLLPAEVTHLGRYHGGNALLHDAQLRAAADRAQRDRRHHLTRKIRVVELVAVAQALSRDELEIRAAEGIPVAGREVAERHPELAAQLGIELIDLAREAVRRQPA